MLGKEPTVEDLALRFATLEPLDSEGRDRKDLSESLRNSCVAGEPAVDDGRSIDEREGECNGDDVCSLCRSGEPSPVVEGGNERGCSEGVILIGTGKRFPRLFFNLGKRNIEDVGVGSFLG